MKNVLALILTAILAFGAAGCGNSEDAETPTSTPVAETPAEDVQNDTEETAPTSSTNEAVSSSTDETQIIEEEEVPLADAPVSETFEVHVYAMKVIELINEERAEAGLPALTLDMDAAKAAQLRAEECRNSFGHTRPDGSSCFTALEDAGVSYEAVAENIAGKIQSPEKVVEIWMDSDGHRENILSSQYTSIGVGYADGGYWSQFFIG